MRPTFFSTLLIIFAIIHSSQCDFNTDFIITSGDGRAKILNKGSELQLSMDEITGSGAETINSFMYGKFDMQMKFVPGNAKGTVTAFYLNSKQINHNEVDFEFLGGTDPSQYFLSTNVFINGRGSREQYFKFWFDPTTDFHTYTMLWTLKQIIWYIDGTPIRVFRKGDGTITLPYVENQALKVQVSIWDGSAWTQPVDWTQAPFTAWYQNYNARACVINGNNTNNNTSCENSAFLMNQELSADDSKKMADVQKKYLGYNYCNDPGKQFENTAKECAINSP
ncbi:hypothetical protein LUZ60_008570 [Juncus effusus]|nr:hypothetical protein LUZ60_008570 [Juncus effusus]